MGIPTGASNSSDHTHVVTPSQVVSTGSAGTDTQAVAAALNVVLEEVAAMTEEMVAHSHNAAEASKEARAEEKAALLGDALGPINADAGQGGGGDGHPSKGDHKDPSTNTNTTPLHRNLALDLSVGNNLRAATATQMAENQSIYSSKSPELIKEEINSLITSLESDSKGLSSTTLKTASSHLGIAAQLATQLSNPSQAENSTNIRQDIQAHIASAYTAIFIELLENPKQITAILSTTNTKEAAETMTSTLVEAKNGHLAIPGGNFMEVMQAVMRPQDESTSPPPPTMQVVSNQKLCELLGAFAAAVQNNQVEAIKYSSASAESSAEIASNTVEAAAGQLNYVTNELRESQEKQAEVEKKQKEAGIWGKVGVALMCVAIVIVVAVMYTAAIAATAVTGGLASPSFIAATVVSAALLAIMTTSIAATFSDDCPDLMSEATGQVSIVLVQQAGMSKKDASIAATVIVLVLMLVVSCGVSAGFAPASAASQGVAVGTSGAAAETASTISAKVVELAVAISKAVSAAAKAASTAAGEIASGMGKISAQAVADAAVAAAKAAVTAVCDLILLIPRAIVAAPEWISAISKAATVAEQLTLIVGPVSSASVFAGVIVKVNEGVTQIQLGQILMSLSKNIANLGTAQANVELMNFITDMQTKQSGVTMEAYQGIVTRLSNTAIQEGAGAGKTLADQLA